MTDMTMPQEVAKSETRTEKLGGIFSTIAVIALLLGALTVTCDVLMRAFFGTAIFALNEVIAQLFAVAVAATLPAGAIGRVNLKVDMLASQFGPVLTRVLTVGGAVLLALTFIILAWETYELAVKYQARGSRTALLYWPTWPTYVFLTGAFALTAVLMVKNTYDDLVSPIEGGGERTTVLGYITFAIFAVIVALIGGWAIWDIDGLRGFAWSAPGQAAMIGFALLWLGVFLQIPLAAISAIVGIGGTAIFLQLDSAASVFAQDAGAFLTNPLVATLPLFLMMGSFAVSAGVSTDIYRLASAVLGRMRGGPAYTTVAGCAGFGAISGNSIATAATFGRIALPEMAKRGYPAALSSGTVAAGGTLGSLVPPSGAIILFALLTEQSIARLFVAAMIPAVLAILLYFAVIFIMVRRSGLHDDTMGEKEPFLPSLKAAIPVILLFGVVIGGLYSGVFTTTESAAVGAFGAFLLALLRGKLNPKEFFAVMRETSQTTALIYGLIFGALIFSYFINIGDAPSMVTRWIGGFDAQPIVILICLLVFYLLLGAVMDSYAVMVITVPIVTPLIMSLGYDVVYWGILMLVIVELGLITPPFGINLFVIKSLQSKVDLGQVMKGVMPFILADLVKIAILIGFPALVLWLPSTM